MLFDEQRGQTFNFSVSCRDMSPKWQTKIVNITQPYNSCTNWKRNFTSLTINLKAKFYPASDVTEK